MNKLFEVQNPCLCGCGEMVNMYRINRYSGVRKRTYFIRNHVFRVLKYKNKYHYGWKGGRRINKWGYVDIYAPEHPRSRGRRKYIREHILVMEKHLGRYLRLDEFVHHKNHIKTDNRIENLELVSRYEHKKIYHPKQREQYFGMKCPICHGDDVVRKGLNDKKDKQRWKCRVCKIGFRTGLLK